MNPEQKKNHQGGSRLQKTEKKPREKRPGRPRTRRQKVLRGLYIALTVIAAVIVAGFIAWNLITAPPDVDDPSASRKPQSTTMVDDDGNEIEVEIPGLSADRKKQFYTFLVVGQDTFGGGNTDTMMLAAYDVPNQRLSVMSLPRDTYVEYYGRKVLLNSVYNRAGGGDDGIAALKEEVGELTGVVPDFHVIIQWEAVGKLVDAIDGVWFDVPRRMYYNDLSQDFKIDLKEGYQLLDGSDAMGLLRWRHNSDDSGHILNSGYATGDLGRIETQQSFMKAVVAKCLQPDVLLPNLMEYISIFQENVVTNLNVSNMAYFGKSAIGGLDMDNVEFLTMPNKSAGDGAHLLPIASEILEVVNERFNPYLEDLRLNELDVVSSISSGSSGGKGGQTAATPPPARPVEETPDVGTEPSPSPAPSGESTPPAAAETPAPSGSAAPIQTPVQSAAPAATPSPVQTAQPTPPPAETPVTTPDGASGPGMEPIE